MNANPRISAGLKQMRATASSGGSWSTERVGFSFDEYLPSPNFVQNAKEAQERINSHRISGNSFLTHTNDGIIDDKRFEREVSEFETQIKEAAAREAQERIDQSNAFKFLDDARKRQKEAEARELEAARLLEIEERKEFLSSPLANTW